MTPPTLPHPLTTLTSVCLTFTRRSAGKSSCEEVLRQLTGLNPRSRIQIVALFFPLKYRIIVSSQCL